MEHAAAVEIAQEALVWLAREPAELARFLAASGVAAATLRARAGDPEFLGFVLDFLLENEQAVLTFAAATGLRPEDPARARAGLPGGELPHWT